MLRVLASALLLAALGACTGVVHVPPVAVDLPDSTPVPGHYAAQVQSGGWQLSTETESHNCGAWTFEGDLNGPYDAAMRDALEQTLESVEFIDQTLAADEIAASDYDAQIVVYQTNARSAFTIKTGFWQGSSLSGMELTTVLAIITDEGLVHQGTIVGKGEGKVDVFTCNTAGEAVSQAAVNAIRDVTEKTALDLRSALGS